MSPTFSPGPVDVIQLGSLAGTGGYLGNNKAGSAVTFEIGGKGSATSFAGQIVDTPPSWDGGTTAIKVVGGALTLTGTNNYSEGPPSTRALSSTRKINLESGR